MSALPPDADMAAAYELLFIDVVRVANKRIAPAKAALRSSWAALRI